MRQRGRPNAFRAWLPASLSASSSFEAPSANQGGQLHLVGSFCTAVRHEWVRFDRIHLFD
jgi:hypothetical protein